MKNSLHLPCTCSTHMLAISKDEDETVPMWYFCYWKYGHGDGELSWKNRFRYIWLILTKGSPYADDVVFEKKELEILRDYLNEQLK